MITNFDKFAKGLKLIYNLVEIQSKHRRYSRSKNYLHTSETYKKIFNSLVERSEKEIPE